MPISDYHGVSAIMGEILLLSPDCVLELGVGFGKWGVLCRELLDAAYGRCRPDQWKTRIYGVEVHPAYRNPAWGAYDHVCVGDFASSFEPITQGCYDLVLMIDSLEHVEPTRGRSLLAELMEANDQMIVSVPNGEMAQQAVFGNAFEEHRWTFNGLEEFEAYNPKLLHQGVCTVVSLRKEKR